MIWDWFLVLVHLVWCAQHPISWRNCWCIKLCEFGWFSTVLCLQHLLVTALLLHKVQEYVFICDSAKFVRQIVRYYRKFIIWILYRFITVYTRKYNMKIKYKVLCDEITCCSVWRNVNLVYPPVIGPTSSHLCWRWSCWLLGSYALEFNKEGTTLL